MSITVLSPQLCQRSRLQGCTQGHWEQVPGTAMLSAGAAEASPPATLLAVQPDQAFKLSLRTLLRSRE